MNIVYLDENPHTACTYLMDVQVRKMILETCQLLMTTDILHGLMRPYKPTHMKHPCRLALEERNNYLGLCDYFRNICEEYRYRFGKSHKCKVYYEMHYRTDAYYTKPVFPQCMPDNCKRDNPVDGYREYYRTKYEEFTRSGIARYTGREKPAWMRREKGFLYYF